MDNGVTELYRRYRPTLFKEVVGQDGACKQLQKLLKNGFPHATLIVGPSGCGKTTLARIVAAKLEASDRDLHEVNAANSRGVDTIREIDVRMHAGVWGGKSRVYILDECHQLTPDAQSALLKMLEDPPSHVYFILCTTDPRKLKDTIRTRCTEVKVNPIPSDLIGSLVKRTSHLCPTPVTDTVAEAIAEAANGSARRSLVLLGKVIHLDTEAEQLEAISKADDKDKAYKIAKALIWNKETWAKVRELIKGLDKDEDWEGIRHLVLANAVTAMLSDNKGAYPRAAACLNSFRDNWYECGRPGLVLACWDVSQEK